MDGGVPEASSGVECWSNGGGRFPAAGGAGGIASEAPSTAFDDKSAASSDDDVARQGPSSPILRRVIAFLDSNDVVSAASVCRLWKHVASEPSYWRATLARAGRALKHRQRGSPCLDACGAECIAGALPQCSGAPSSFSGADVALLGIGDSLTLAESAADMDARRAVRDAATAVRAWTELRALWDALRGNRALWWSLRPGACPLALLNAERRGGTLGRRLPPDFRASLLLHDGQSSGCPSDSVGWVTSIVACDVPLALGEVATATVQLYALAQIEAAVGHLWDSPTHDHCVGLVLSAETWPTGVHKPGAEVCRLLPVAWQTGSQQLFLEAASGTVWNVGQLGARAMAPSWSAFLRAIRWAGTEGAASIRSSTRLRPPRKN